MWRQKGEGKREMEEKQFKLRRNDKGIFFTTSCWSDLEGVCFVGAQARFLEKETPVLWV